MWCDAVQNEPWVKLLSARGIAMNDNLGSPEGRSALIERIKAILLKPKDEWPKIAAEPASPSELVMRYAVPLAAIGPSANFLHGQVFGYGAFGISWHPGLMAGLSGAVVQYVLGIAGIIVLALIADWLAPKFDGVSDRTAAFKLVVYGSIATWLAGILMNWPNQCTVPVSV